MKENEMLKCTCCAGYGWIEEDSIRGSGPNAYIHTSIVTCEECSGDGVVEQPEEEEYEE